MEEIKSTAFLYFQGKISLEDEKVLFDFINDSNENMKLFRQWESEWISGYINEYEMADKWARLQTRMNTSRISLSHDRNRKLNSGWLSVAASIMIIISLSVYLYDRFTGKSNDLYFVSEVPSGQKSKLVLPDGTMVWLNGGSTLKYPNNFSDKKRNVVLDGAGYFEVTSRNGVPFTVSTSAYDIIVKGTKFNVCAYDIDATSLTSLIEGKIEIDYKDELYEVSPGEGVCINKNKGTVESFRSDVDDSNAWIDGRIEYEKITLADFAAKLSRKYGVEVCIENNEIKCHTFRISLKNNETLVQVLDGLQLIIPFEYTIDKDRIIIK